MKRLASLVMAVFLGTSALVAFPPESEAQVRREGPYRTRDFRYGERDRWDRGRSYSPRRYDRGSRRFRRYRGDRFRNDFRSPYRGRRYRSPSRGRYSPVYR